MFCVYCGQKIADEAVFCPFCGQRVNAAPQQAAQPQSPCVQSGQAGPAQPASQTYAAQAAPYSASAGGAPAPQQSPQPAAAAKPARSGVGLGTKLVAVALAGTAAFFGGKALLGGEGGGGEPSAQTRPGYTQPAEPGKPSGSGGEGGQSGSQGGSGGESGQSGSQGGSGGEGGQSGSQGGSGGSSTFYDPDSGRFEGESGVGQRPVARGEAAGMTTEEAASQEIFFAYQAFTYASEQSDPDYESELFILKLDPENGVAYLMGDPDDFDEVIQYNYDPENGTLWAEMAEDEDYARFELIRNPDGSWSGSAHGSVDGESTHAYVELNRATPTKDGAWMLLETGEVFTDDERTALDDTRLGNAFLGRAAEYAAANGYSMKARDPDENTPSYEPIPTLPQVVELSPELIDYYVMVEGQNRLREKAGATVNHIQLPRTDSITEAEFNARVEEYVRRWGANPKK